MIERAILTANKKVSRTLGRTRQVKNKRNVARHAPTKMFRQINVVLDGVLDEKEREYPRLSCPLVVDAMTTIINQITQNTVFASSVT